MNHFTDMWGLWRKLKVKYVLPLQWKIYKWRFASQASFVDLEQIPQIVKDTNAQLALARREKNSKQEYFNLGKLAILKELYEGTEG